MLTDLKFKVKVLFVVVDKNNMKGATEMKTYTVFEKGLVVGTMELSPARVREITAAAVYTLVEGGR
jgi:hypothetical protein